MADNSPLVVGQWVEIGGRTMLRPGFSLVGLTGIVFFAMPHTPPGCLTIAIDWKQHGYDMEESSLPYFVNVPVGHLTPVEPPSAAMETDEPDSKDSEPEKPGPGLRLV